MIKFIVLVSLFFVLEEVSGHGMMLNPPNRSSLWRFDKTAPPNYSDNQNFCGGFATQWYSNGGKCGVCGDNYADKIPRANENTGTYGQGKIVATYKTGEIILVESLITANHRGKVTYHLCQITNSNAAESGESCFQLLTLANGATSYPVSSTDKQLAHKIKLPAGFKCTHCVLRWTYTAGNNWGVCEDGTGAMGCGIQENFRSCADIKII